MLHDVMHLCLIDLIQMLAQAHITQVHLPIYDPERLVNILPAWYSMLKDHLFDSNINLGFHDRVYVSIAAVHTPTSEKKHLLL